MHVRARTRTAAGGGGRPAGRRRRRSGAGPGSGPGSGSGPGLGLGLGFPTRSKRCEPDPLRQQLRTSWIANGCEPIRQPTGANQLDCQRLRTCWLTKGCNGWVERVQPFVRVRTCWALLFRYIKDSMFSIEKTTKSETLSLF